MGALIKSLTEAMKEMMLILKNERKTLAISDEINKEMKKYARYYVTESVT